MKLLGLDKYKDAIEYAGKDTANCLYLYIDLVEYGLDDPNVTVWYEENEKGDFEILVLKYHDCFQVYSHNDDCDLTGLISLINEYNIARVFSKKNIIDRLINIFSDLYSAEYGYVIELKKYKKLAYEGYIEEASLDDLEEIEELLLTDEENAKAYRKGELVTQFAERIKNKKGINYVIRKDNVIVAHCCVSAMTDKFKILALTIVKKEARSFPYGTYIDSFIMNELKEDEIKLFAFMTEPRRIRLFELMGNPIAAEYGKMILNDTQMRK